MLISLSRWRVASLLAMLIYWVAPARAANRANEFPVSSAQMRALGIELVTVQVVATANGTRYPAVVVLPPQQERIVSAAVAGLVNQVLVEQNQVVSAGTPLLVLNSPELGQLQLALVRAANSVRLTAQTSLRERTLFKDGIIAERRVQEATIAESTSRAELAQAKTALVLAGMNEATVDRIADTGRVQTELTVTSPTAGTVIAVEIKPGQRVADADPLVRIARLDSLWLDIQVPSAQVSQWPKGTRLALPGGIGATVLSVSALAANAQTVILRAALASGGAQHLRPGEFVQAELPMTGADAWDIPLAALARDGDQAYVFVRIEDRFVATPVSVLASAGQRVKVRGEVRAGQQIAGSGVLLLKAAWQGVGGIDEE